MELWLFSQGFFNEHLEKQSERPKETQISERNRPSKIPVQIGHNL